MKALKMKEVKKELSEIGISIKFTEYEEYRVNFIGGREATAYYTTDLDDAIATGKAMVKK